MLRFISFVTLKEGSDGDPSRLVSTAFLKGHGPGWRCRKRSGTSSGGISSGFQGCPRTILPGGIGFLETPECWNDRMGPGTVPVCSRAIHPFWNYPPLEALQGGFLCPPGAVNISDSELALRVPMKFPVPFDKGPVGFPHHLPFLIRHVVQSPQPNPGIINPDDVNRGRIPVVGQEFPDFLPAMRSRQRHERIHRHPMAVAVDMWMTILHGQSTSPHCSAIAAAMPGRVRLLSFQRLGPGGSFQILCSLPSTMLVGFNSGRFLSQRHVALVSPCPNCQGWMIWSGPRPTISRAYLCMIGFSPAMCGIGSSIKSLNDFASDTILIHRSVWIRFDLSLNSHLTPELHMQVHSRWKISISQF